MTNTSKGDKVKTLTAKQRTELAKLAAMSDADAERLACEDTDNPPLTPAQLKTMVRLTYVKRIRIKLGISQQEFAERFQIPIGTIRDWEQRRCAPDAAALALLRVIDADAKRVEKVLEAHK